jgi:hypothetical protein
MFMFVSRCMQRHFKLLQMTNSSICMFMFVSRCMQKHFKLLQMTNSSVKLHYQYTNAQQTKK